jgi:AraC-like DNA-binding protein
MKRIGTRMLGPSDEYRYMAIKMPRSAYNAHFRRDAARNYIGMQPEREWTEQELMRAFGMYQDKPMHEMLEAAR